MSPKALAWCRVGVENGSELTDEAAVTLDEEVIEMEEDWVAATPDEVAIVLIVEMELELEAFTFGGGAVLLPGLRNALAASRILVIWPFVKDVMHAS